MKRIVTIALIVSLIFTSSLFAANNAQNYDTISLYVHGTLGLDALTNSLSIPKKSYSADREGVIVKLGIDAYKNEDLGAKIGATAGLELDIPFRSVKSGTGLDLGKLPYLGLSGGMIFRSRPWDYIDVSLSLKGVASTYDYKAISLGIALEPTADIYFDDNIYMKVALSYGSDIVKFPFKGDDYLVISNLPSHFSISLGAGFAFGGYSK